MTLNQASPFTMFSDQHLSVMFIILALTLSLPLLIKKIDSEQIIRTVAIGFGVFLLLVKITEPFVRGDSLQNWQDELPLHLCDLAAILTGIMLINRSYFFYELTYFWGFGGALQAMITPSLKYGFPHIEIDLAGVCGGCFLRCPGCAYKLDFRYQLHVSFWQTQSAIPI